MFKARMKFCKEGRARFISHLDLMKSMQRSIARAGLPVWYTEGFNRHAYVSVALPLSTGYSSEYEIMDFNFTCDTVPQDAVEKMNAVMPEGLRVLEIYPQEMKVGDIAYSEYKITYEFDGGVPKDFKKDVLALFAREEIELVKRTKRSEKPVNIQEFIHEINVSVLDDKTAIILAVNKAGNDNLSPEYISRAIKTYLPEIKFDGVLYHRTAAFNKNLKKFK